MNLATSRQISTYSDWANTQILAAAGALTDVQLDQPFDMSRGTLRRTLLHTYAGEHVWLQRCQGHAETPWIDEDEPAAVAAIRERFAATWRERDAFLAALTDGSLARMQTYRDSYGTLFQAALGDMLLQMHLHSTHHRAQLVSMLRRLGAPPIELDYMYWRRQPS